MVKLSRFGYSQLCTRELFVWFFSPFNEVLVLTAPTLNVLCWFKT